MENLPKRKPYRLPNYDYSSNGAYFITVCTKDRRKILSQINVGTSIARPSEVQLTDVGEIVDKAIREIPEHYEGVFVDSYVVMPNHIHMIIRIDNSGGRAMLVPTLSRVIQQMKGFVTKQVGKPVWQEKSYDHVIRNEEDYLLHLQYIDENANKWLIGKDEYYI